MSKIKKLFTNWRMILLIIFLIFAIIAIRPNPFKEGVAIKSVLTNSPAALAGIENPKPTVSPMSREIIQSMNNVPINTLDDYYSFLDSLEANRSVRIKTNR